MTRKTETCRHGVTGNGCPHCGHELRNSEFRTRAGAGSLQRWVKRKKWEALRDAEFHHKRGATLAKRFADGRASVLVELLKRFPKRPLTIYEMAVECVRSKEEET